MKRWIILTLLMVVVVSVVSAQPHIQLSTDNATWTDLNSTQYSGSIGNGFGVGLGLEDSKIYYVRVKNDSTTWTYTTARTKAGDEESMASLSIMLFLSAITCSIIFIGWKVKIFQHEIADYIVRRCLLIIGIWLVSLDTAILASIAEAAALGITDHILRILWMVNMTAYISMLGLFIISTFKIIRLFTNPGNQSERYAEDEG